MPNFESELALLRHPRLSALATSAWPAWLWSLDGTRILWANAVGAAMFGAEAVAQCLNRRFVAEDFLAGQIIRLAATLPSRAQERLERLRGLGAGFGRALTCACSRIVLSDGRVAILIAATEPAGPTLTLAERVRRLLADDRQALAVFSPAGHLLHATEPAMERLGGTTTLAALNIETMVAEALESGSASGTVDANQDSGGVADDAAMLRLGENTSRALLLVLPPPKPRAPSTTAGFATAESQPAPILPASEVNVGSTPSMPARLRSEAQDEPFIERRHPLRFVWQMDAEGRFVVGSDEFIELMGPQTTAAFGRLWSEIAGVLRLDPENQLSRAVATKETWSGIKLLWPVDESSERLAIELSGLPVFDRERVFLGYRGFGVCRDIARLNQLARKRRERTVDVMPEPAPVAAIPNEMVSAAQVVKATEPTLLHEHPMLSVMSTVAANVVPFRPAPPAEPKAPDLSPVERTAFRELAQELTARLRRAQSEPAAAEGGAEDSPAEESVVSDLNDSVQETASSASPDAVEDIGDVQQTPPTVEHILLDRVPSGVLVYRNDTLLYANRHFFELSGYESLEALAAAGGLDSLFVTPANGALADVSAQPLSIMTRRGEKLPVEGRLFTIPWHDGSALALILTGSHVNQRQRAIEAALGAAESENRELKSVIDTAADGVLVVERDGRILTANARAHALFVTPIGNLYGRLLLDLFAPESKPAARHYLDSVVNGAPSPHREISVEAGAGEGRLIALTMMLSSITADRFCAVFRDASVDKKNEEDLRAAKREAARAAAAKTDFLGKISHEIRTPLNAMIGFSEVIMAERFGAIGNERYREYLKDIHAAGTHLVSMLNDLLDLSKIETGQLDLTIAAVNLNELVQQCVGIMQPQANRERIIIRTSLTPGLPRIMADERSLRQITLTLLGNAIKFTGPGGQVILSTIVADSGEAVLRVRDTGAGMSEKDVEAVLEPFGQAAASGNWGSGSTAFSLPLAKALAEANHANFSIKSAPNAGTLVEVAFATARNPAQ